MPIYEYDCLSCGSSFDKLVRGSSAIKQITCPQCDGDNVKKKLSLFSSRIVSSRAAVTTSGSAGCAPSGL